VQSGRISEVFFGGGTSYSQSNILVNQPGTAHPGDLLATVTDTLTTAGGGFTTVGSKSSTFSCNLSTTCALGNAPSIAGAVNATPLINSATAFNNSAKDFVNANQSLYNSATVTLTNKSVAKNAAGTVATYNITGTYTIDYSRLVTPWTSDDVIHDAMTVQKRQLGTFSITGTPDLGFTSQQAANLSGFSNFNYVQTYVAAGTFTPGAAATNTPRTTGSILSNATLVLPGTTNTPDPRVIGSTDPLYDSSGQNGSGVGGNPGRPADLYQGFYNQVPVPGATPDSYVTFQGSSLGSTPSNNYGLNFNDQPDLVKAGNFLVYRTQLMGVTETESGGVITPTSFDPLMLSVPPNGQPTVDPNTIFNWVWYQNKDDPQATCGNCGEAVLTDGTVNSDSAPLGEAFFLGYGDMSMSQIEDAINADLAEMDLSTAGGVPELSTWVMMAAGFGGLGLARWRASRKGAGLAV
jgi:hypothetical protein